MAETEAQLNKLTVKVLRERFADGAPHLKLKKDLVTALLQQQQEKPSLSESAAHGSDTKAEGVNESVQDAVAREEEATAQEAAQGSGPKRKRDEGDTAGAEPGTNETASEPELKRPRTSKGGDVDTGAGAVTVVHDSLAPVGTHGTGGGTPSLPLPLPRVALSEGVEEDESEEDALNRFRSELEFVQCLSNPRYLSFLSTEGYFDETSDKGRAMVGYLHYLSYWRRPEYAKFVLFPNALEILDLLRDNSFRQQIANARFVDFLNNQEIAHWGFFFKNRTVDAQQRVVTNAFRE